MTRNSLLMRPGVLSGARAAAVTVAVTGLAALVAIVAAPLLVSTPFMVFTGAVIVSAWFGGWLQGVLSALIGALPANYFVLAPQGRWSVGPIDLLRTVLWVVFVSSLALLLSWL